MVGRIARPPCIVTVLLAARLGAALSAIPPALPPPPTTSPFLWPREQVDAYTAARLRRIADYYTNVTRLPCTSSVPAIVGAGCSGQRASNCSTAAIALDERLEARVWRECWGSMSMLALPQGMPKRRTVLLKRALDFMHWFEWKGEARRPLLRDLAVRPARRFGECAVTSGLYPANESDIPALDAMLTGTRGPLIRPNHMCAESIRPRTSPGKRPPYHRRPVDISVINGGVNSAYVCGACNVEVPVPRTGLALVVRPLDVSTFVNARKCLNASQPNVSFSVASVATVRLAYVLSAAFSERSIWPYTHPNMIRSPVPSTGFLAVVFALLHCERVVLYGFGGPLAVGGHLMGDRHDVLSERRAVAALSVPKHERSRLAREVLMATGAQSVRLVY